MMKFLIIVLVYLFGFHIEAKPLKHQWHEFKTIAGTRSESIGGYSRGCLMGAVELPETGVGFETIRRHRKRFYGHRHLTDFLRDYGQKVDQAGLESILIGDMSQIRGGRMNFGHRSHQIGLDADIWFSSVPRKARKTDTGFPSMVHLDTETIDRRHWSPAQKKLLHMAALDQRVARIFVHWVIKRELCKGEYADRTWLAKIRPWWGHSSHFHIRLACPKGDTDCVNQSNIGPDDGCGHERWFSKAAVTARKRTNKTKDGHTGKSRPKPLHPRCQKLLTRR